MATPSTKRIVIVILDSVGCGALPDAASYGDAGANTLGHVASHVGGLNLPGLQELGLGNVIPLAGMSPVSRARGAFGKLGEISAGKDTATGHWELAGLKIDTPFPVFPDGFPEEITQPFCERTGRGILGNKPASGTEIIKELGEEHRATGDLIVYTSGDSVFQIAAHEDTVPVSELYKYCEIARDLLDPYRVARVIARPFVGASANEYKRTYNRRDYAMPPPAPTVLDAVAKRGLPVVGVGKIFDIYAGRGVTQSIHTQGNPDGMNKTIAAMADVDAGVIMVNLVDFDSKYGHRRNPDGYYECLREFDAQLPALHKAVRPQQDVVILTADHGNDPTMPGSDHTREYVPLLAFGPPAAAGVDLGTRQTFADVGATVAEVFGVAPPPYGTSFLAAITGEATK